MKSKGKAGANEHCRGAKCREHNKYAVENVWGFQFSYLGKLAQNYSATSAFSR